MLFFLEKKELKSTLGKMLLLFIVFNCLCAKVMPTWGFFWVAFLCLFVWLVGLVWLLDLIALFGLVKHLK